MGHIYMYKIYIKKNQQQKQTTEREQERERERKHIIIWRENPKHLETFNDNYDSWIMNSRRHSLTLSESVSDWLAQSLTHWVVWNLKQTPLCLCHKPGCCNVPNTAIDTYRFIQQLIAGDHKCKALVLQTAMPDNCRTSLSSVMGIYATLNFQW